MWAVDLGDLDAAEQVALEAWDAFGGLDVLVQQRRDPEAHARVTDLTPHDVQTRDGRRLPLPRPHDARGAARACSNAKSGTIVFVSSMGGRIPIANESAYNAAKYAMCGFAEAMLPRPRRHAASR